MANERYIPNFEVKIDGALAPAAFRASITGINHQSGLEGADRVEISLVNENLRWLDHPLLEMDTPLSLSLGYAPDPLTEVFVGEIVGQSVSFPSGSAPTMTVVAQDRRHRLQKGTRLRWFSLPLPIGALPLPDLAIGAIVTASHLLVPFFEPVGAAISLLLSGADALAVLSCGNQGLVRKQMGESDYDFLNRVAKENGLYMYIDHSQDPKGHLLRFMSPLDKLSADLTLTYGKDLLDFSPRVSTVGQIGVVTVTIPIAEIQTEFTVTLGYDWDKKALTLSIFPNVVLAGPAGEIADAAQGAIVGAATSNEGMTLAGEPVTLLSAPRILLSKLIPQLNERITGSGSTIGDLRIKPGGVVQVEGIGETFGGRYRVVSVTHSLDTGGFRTSFEVRKEIWFGTIPPADQGAMALQPATSLMN